MTPALNSPIFPYSAEMLAKEYFQNLLNIASFFKQKHAQMIHCKRNRSGFSLSNLCFVLLTLVSISDKMQI